LVINILGVVILFAAVIGTIGAFYREKKTIHIIYLVVVIIAFVFQVVTAIVVYQLTANTKIWLSKIWSEETKEYREYAQNKFSCCGFANPLDHPVVTNICSATDNKSNNPPCFEPLVHFIAHELAIVYIILFSAISIELLAICNSITLLCT
ncbi:Tetraspanin/Peripherin, partial [Chlamydoabsidia padenii]